MTRSTAESKLEELRTFLLELSRNQTLVNNPEAKLRQIPIQATSYERELTGAIREVRRNWGRG